jgi:hypothetical protein
VASKCSTALIGLSASIVMMQEAQSAEIKGIPAKSGNVVVTITGDITPGDADTLTAIVKQANGVGKLVANVRLNSDGGNLLEGVKLADVVRFGKISTNVGKSATCASACFLVFAAGQTKYASYGAQIGVHGASDQSGDETVSSDAATVSMAKIAKELGVPPTIIGRMVVTPPREMVWLTPQDLQSMGVSMLGRPLQTETSSGASLQQTPSSGPTSILPPQTQAVAPTSSTATGVPSWSEMVDKATQRSASQNNGKPMFDRGCQPDLKVCITSISYVDTEGNAAFLKRVEDLEGKTIAREACTLNKFGDVRTCLNWDNQTMHKDMKNERGDWIEVSGN